MNPKSMFVSRSAFLSFPAHTSSLAFPFSFHNLDDSALLPYLISHSGGVVVCPGRVSAGRITEGSHRISASGCFTHRPAWSVLDKKRRGCFTKSLPLATATRLKLSRLPHEKEIEILYLSSSSPNNGIQNQRSLCEDIKFLERLDTKLQQWYRKGREKMLFPEAEWDIKDSKSRAEIKASMMHSGQMFWHLKKATKLGV